MNEYNVILLYVLGAWASYYVLTKNQPKEIRKDAWIHAGFWPVVWLMILLMVFSDFLNRTRRKK